MSSDGSGQPTDNHESDQPSSTGHVNHGFSDPDRQGQDAIQTRHLTPGVSAPMSDLPDILNSTLPPYTSPEHTLARSSGNNRGQVRRSFGRQPRVGQRRRDTRHPRDTYVLEDDLDDLCDKNCCAACLTISTQFKWILVLLAIIGLCCVVTGIILGALHMTGSSFLTLSLMFIGLGVMLVVVVIIGWRCTPAGHEPCHLLFNLGEYSHNNRRRGGGHRRRSGNGRDRLNNWSGGIIYGDQYHRPPPPSYAASMQDYERQNAVNQHPNPDSLPSSPPPTYKSQASLQRPGIHITFPHIIGGDYPSSRPPTYRSHHSNTITHSRQISFQDSEQVETPQRRDIVPTPTGTLGSATGASSPTGTLGSATGASSPTGTLGSATGASSPTGTLGSATVASSPTGTLGSATGASSPTGTLGSATGASSPTGTLGSATGAPSNHGILKHTNNAVPTDAGEAEGTMLRAGHYGTAERHAVECLEDILDVTMRDMNVEYQAGTLRPGSQVNKVTDGASETPGSRVDGHIRQSSGPAQIRHGVQPVQSLTLPHTGSKADKERLTSKTLPRRVDVTNTIDTMVPSAAAHSRPVVYSQAGISGTNAGRSRHGTSLVQSVQAVTGVPSRDERITIQPRGQVEREPQTSGVSSPASRAQQEACQHEGEGAPVDPGEVEVCVVDTDIPEDITKSESRQKQVRVRVNSISGQSAL